MISVSWCCAGYYATNVGWWCIFFLKDGAKDEILDKIASNGGYAIVISYDKAGNSDYWDTYWYVGFEVSASIKSGGIRYEITKHSGNEIHLTSDLTLDEAMEYTPMNFS